MRLTTIWTLPGMDLTERFRRTRDLAAMRVAWRLPRRVRYWVFATARIPSDVVVPNATLTDAMEYEGVEVT